MERADKYQQLKALIESESHKEVSQLSEEILGTSPDDSDAKLCFAISCIRSNNIKALQPLFKSVPTYKDSDQLQIVYAYYLYLSQQYVKAIKFIQEIKQDFQAKLLLSQCYFKSHDYQKASVLLTDLVKQKQKEKSPQVSNLMVNLLASLSSSTESSKVVEQLGIAKTEGKEIQFNLAQLYSESNKVLSKQYLAKFTSTLKLPDDQEDRVASLLLNDFMQKSGSMDVEQEKVIEYQSLSEKEFRQTNLDIVISNNLAVFKQRQTGEHHPQTFKEIEELLATKAKQTRQQVMGLKINKLILLLRRNRLVEAQKLLKDIEMQHNPQQTSTQVLMKARLFLFIKSHDNNSAETLISKASEDMVLQFLLRIQYLRQTKQLGEIFAEYKKAPKEILNNETISKYIISLVLKDQKLFENQLEQLNQMAVKTNDVKLMKLLVEMFKNKGDTAKTQSNLERVLKINPKDEEATLQLAQIRLAQGNVSVAEELLKAFQRPHEITDMNYLQNLQNNIHFSISKTTEANKLQTMSKLKKRIKKKKVRYPKNFDPKNPGLPPNPQRWLPKHQRKDFKKKKNYKSGRTQGATNVGKETVNTYTSGNTTSNINVNTGKNKRRKN